MAAEKFHGWSIEEGTHANGKQMIELSKRERATVTVLLGKDTPAAVGIERGKVTALEQDVARSSPDDRDLWEKRLAEAIRERDRARVARTQEAELAARFPREEA